MTANEDGIKELKVAVESSTNESRASTSKLERMLDKLCKSLGGQASETEASSGEAVSSAVSSRAAALALRRGAIRQRSPGLDADGGDGSRLLPPGERLEHMEDTKADEEDEDKNL